MTTRLKLNGTRSKRNPYQLYRAIELRYKNLQILEQQLNVAEHHQEASDVRWACILLETTLTQLSRKIGKWNGSKEI